MLLNKLSLFNNAKIDEKAFLKEYWHKKPLLLSQAVAIKDLKVLPNKSQLMKLSCNENIQSRVVIKSSETDFDVELGPFFPDDLLNFKDYCWNLLISDVDKWQPKSREILNYFNFIRNWIFDDIMISTGSVGGTVGPHTDHYDVFLLQVHGQRQWQYSTKKTYDPQLIPEQSLKLLQNFKADELFILNPGDVLYLPPEIAHYGVATTEDCVTCSIGVRTPSHSELLTSFVDNIAQNISAEQRFQEPQFSTQPQMGEITAKDLENISTILSNNLNSNDIIQWFGKFITEYRSIFYEYNQFQDINELSNTTNLQLSPFSKTCYFKNNNLTNLFINGEQFNSSIKLAILICDKKYVSAKELSELIPKDKIIIKKLFENGSIVKSI